MDAAQFLKRKTVTEGEQAARASTEGRGSQIVSGGAEDHNLAPSATVYRDATPSGIVVEYQPEQYLDGKKLPRLYRVNGAEVPSVTTVLDVLRKDGLSFWGQDVGVRAILELFARGRLGTRINWDKDTQRIVHAGLQEAEHDATAESLKALITAEKLSCNHVLNKAGDRGTNVHSALEAWARSNGEFFPTPQNFPDEERPYVEGLLQFVDTIAGKGRPVLCEVMVGSAEHGFAGRYDLVVELFEPVEFIAKAYKRKEPKTVTLGPGRFLGDAKTSSGVYDSHHLQLAAYEGASIECGYQPTDGRFVLHLTKDGAYEVVPSRATFDQFLAVKKTHDALKELKG